MPLLRSAKSSFDHEYFKFSINSLNTISANSRTVVLDFTVTDKKDGLGVSGFDSILTLELNNASVNNGNSQTDPRLSSSGKVIVEAVNRMGMGNFANSDLDGRLGQYGIKYPDLRATRQLIFGASQAEDTWGVFDSQSRRGILIFNLPGEGTISEWSLTSSLLPDMKVAVENTVYANQELLSEKPSIAVDNAFELALGDAVTGRGQSMADQQAGDQRNTIGDAG